MILTNDLPTGAILIRVAPTDLSYTTLGGSLLFIVGNLSAGGGLDLQLTVQTRRRRGADLFRQSRLRRLERQ